MNAILASRLVEADGEIRELSARVKDCEEAIRSLQRQLVAVRNHLDDLELSRELEAVR